MGGFNPMMLPPQEPKEEKISSWLLAFFFAFIALVVIGLTYGIFTGKI